jgi:peptidoglycan hydrolase-like protein with peptidoglycan-binding domain
LQQQLNQLGFNTGGVNGVLTPQTKNALYQAEIQGYRVEDNKLVKKDEEFFKKLNPRKSNYSNNYPPAEAAKDAIVGTSNRMYRFITGNNDYIIKNPDINDIPASQKEVLKTRYKQYAPKGGDLVWDEQKYL